MEISMNGRKYAISSDLHTHTTFSHGKGSIEDNVLAARERGIKKIGITDHGPGHLFYGLNRKDVPVMRKEIERLKLVCPDMKICLGVEANIMNKSGKLDVRPREFSDYDYVIAGYHYGVAGENPVSAAAVHGKNLLAEKTGRCSKQLMKENTDLVVRALHTNDIRILTHPGDKAPVDLLEIAVACADTSTLVEINTWHDCLTPEDLNTMALADIRFIISSDAHTPGRVGDFIPAVELLLKSKVDPERVINLCSEPVSSGGA